MVPALVFAAFVLAVALVAWRGTGSRVRVRTCCSAQEWPPRDLTGDAPRAPGSAP